MSDDGLGDEDLTKLFALLLRGFSATYEKAGLPRTNRERIQHVLESFRSVYDEAAKSAAEESAQDAVKLATLIKEFDSQLEGLRKTAEKDAPDFNILEVLQLTSKEVRHSMLLAWLFDRNPGKFGTHCQGARGFHLFLQRAGLPLEYARSPYRVRREVVGQDARIDVEISSRREFLIHIEVKILASEGADQTIREWEDLLRRALALEILPDKVHAFFLTPNGTEAESPNFHAITWVEIARVLDDFALSSEPPDVKLFAAHYAKALRRYVIDSPAEENYG